MEVVQLAKFKRELRAQQTVAIHDLGENREIIAVGATLQYSGRIAPY